VLSHLALWALGWLLGGEDYLGSIGRLEEQFGVV